MREHFLFRQRFEYSRAFPEIIQQNKVMTDSIYDFRNFM